MRYQSDFEKEIEDGTKPCQENNVEDQAKVSSSLGFTYPGKESSAEDQTKARDCDSPKGGKDKRKHKKGTLKKLLVFVAILAAVKLGYDYLSRQDVSEQDGKAYVFDVGSFYFSLREKFGDSFEMKDIIHIGTEFYFGGHRYRIVGMGWPSEKYMQLVRKARMENGMNDEQEFWFIVYEKYSFLYFYYPTVGQNAGWHVQQID